MQRHVSGRERFVIILLLSLLLCLIGPSSEMETLLSKGVFAQIPVIPPPPPPPPPQNDITGPSLSITSHSNGQTVPTSTITVSGTASDAGRGDNGVSSITVNGTSASGGTASGSGTANWSQSITLNQGANTITVVAKDASLNQNDSATQSITVNYTPITRILTLASSSPNNGVSIAVSPSDNNGQGNGATQFSRTYYQNISVTMTAPATVGRNNFQKWQRNGTDYSLSQAVSLTMDANYTMTSVYVTPPTGVAGSTTTGYVMLATDGGIFNFESSRFFGSLPAMGFQPASPLQVIQNTATELGYYVLGRDGGIFAFGDARFLGSLPGLGITNQTVDMEPTATGNGYYMLGLDGGIFAFGDSQFFGSLPQLGIQTQVLDMELTSSGQGYWILGVDGGVFSFGDAQFFGSLPQLEITPNRPLKKIKSTASGQGYYMLGEDGGLFAFGDAAFHGSLPQLGITTTTVDLEVDKAGLGYYILGINGKVYVFGTVVFFGDLPALGINTTILDMDLNKK